MKEPKFSSGDYLNKKLEDKFEPFSEEELAESVLGQYIGEKTKHYRDYEWHNAELENEDVKLEYKYGPLEFSLKQALKDKDFMQTGDPIAIEGFKIVNKHNHNEFDFHKIAPESVLLFNPNIDNSQVIFLGFEKEAKKLFIVSGEPNSLKSILALFHEVGHSVDWDQKDLGERELLSDSMSRYHLSKENPDSILDNRSATQTLRAERDAWAYALKIARKVLPNLAKEGVVSKFIHEYALGSYSDPIHKKLNAEKAPNKGFANSILEGLKKYFIK